jgi:hypothetical protein
MEEIFADRGTRKVAMIVYCGRTEEYRGLWQSGLSDWRLGCFFAQA